jgi:hypothetical protein
MNSRERVHQSAMFTVAVPRTNRVTISEIMLGEWSGWIQFRVRRSGAPAVA